MGSSTSEVYTAEFNDLFSETTVLDDALTDASLGLDSELLTECIAGAYSDCLNDNALLSGAATTLRNLLPDHLREWEGAADVIANLLALRVNAAFADRGAV